MKKHLLLYAVLMIPAMIVAYTYANGTALSQILQWGFALVMIAGWAVNSGVAAYRYPSATLAFLLLYAGVNIFAVSLLYRQPYNSAEFLSMRHWIGAISFRPLDILVNALSDFMIPLELCVLCVLAALCLIGFLVGVLYRRLRPNPYHPRIMRSR